MTDKLTITRLEAALNILADDIISFGDVGLQLIPVYEKLENKLTEMQKENMTLASIRNRATRHLDQKIAQS